MKIKHSNIPVFLPELACPHRCVFCNQSRISGQQSIPSFTNVVDTVEQHLRTLASDTVVQVAFFGGSFTGLPLQVQEGYLSLVKPYLASGAVSGIRVSTRPDYITDEILDLLVSYGVVDVELGAQSFDDGVLKASGRGHKRGDITNASQLILSRGLGLGLQMMIGLPADSLDKSLHTARSIIDAGAHSTRIYPTLVIRDTPLAQMYARGEYTPLTLDEAVGWTAELYRLFEQGGVTVLRTGLHPNEDFKSGKSLVDGPYHPLFKELVMSRIWFRLLEEALPLHRGRLTIHVPENQVNYAIGYNSENRQRLKERTGWIRILSDKSLHGYEFHFSYH